MNKLFVTLAVLGLAAASAHADGGLVERTRELDRRIAEVRESRNLPRCGRSDHRVVRQAEAIAAGWGQATPAVTEVMLADACKHALLIYDGPSRGVQRVVPVEEGYIVIVATYPGGLAGPPPGARPYAHTVYRYWFGGKVTRLDRTSGSKEAMQ